MTAVKDDLDLGEILMSMKGVGPVISAVFLGEVGEMNRLKALCWKNDGFVLLYKRLERGKFQWPRKESEARMITPQQTKWLLSHDKERVDIAMSLFA